MQRKGHWLFGVLDLAAEGGEYGFAIGLRTGNDRSLALQLICGVRVFVCSNMAFSGDFLALKRKHTAGLSLDVLDDYDSLYEPHLIGQRAWPLMKLRRFDEARAVARRAIATGNAWQKDLGLNGLCAIEAEARSASEWQQTSTLAAQGEAGDRRGELRDGRDRQPCGAAAWDQAAAAVRLAAPGS